MKRVMILLAGMLLLFAGSRSVSAAADGKSQQSHTTYSKAAAEPPTDSKATAKTSTTSNAIAEASAGSNVTGEIPTTSNTTAEASADSNATGEILTDSNVTAEASTDSKTVETSAAFSISTEVNGCSVEARYSEEKDSYVLFLPGNTQLSSLSLQCSGAGSTLCLCGL